VHMTEYSSEELTLTDIHGNVSTNALFSQIKDAYLELYRAKFSGKFCVTVKNTSELEMEIYSQTIVITDYGRFAYDGPGSPAEIVSIRYREETILPVLEKLCELFIHGTNEEIISLLKTLPKPQE
jgi:hypothetical protein